MVEQEAKSSDGVSLRPFTAGSTGYASLELIANSPCHVSRQGRHSTTRHEAHTLALHVMLEPLVDLGIPSVGIEAHPLCHLASSVKVCWMSRHKD